MNPLSDYVIILVPLLISGYTLSFALWLWQQKNKKGALGVAVLAIFASAYPAYVIFFVHQ